MASGHDHFVIGPQIRRDTFSDDAVATCYQNALLSHGVSPSVQWRSEWSLRAACIAHRRCHASSSRGLAVLLLSNQAPVARPSQHITLDEDVDDTLARYSVAAPQPTRLLD